MLKLADPKKIVLINVRITPPRVFPQSFLSVDLLCDAYGGRRLRFQINTYRRGGFPIEGCTSIDIPAALAPDIIGACRVAMEDQPAAPASQSRISPPTVRRDNETRDARRAEANRLHDAGKTIDEIRAAIGGVSRATVYRLLQEPATAAPESGQLDFEVH